MQYHHPTAIDALINEYLRHEGLETPLLRYRATNCWQQVMGDAIAKYTEDIILKDDVLHVKIKSPALRSNLMMMRTDIAHKINTHIGAQIVKSVMFH